MGSNPVETLCKAKIQQSYNVVSVSFSQPHSPALVDTNLRT